MISKGTTHNNGARLASYLTRGKAGERAELWQLRGFEATNIKDAFRDVHVMAAGTKCEQPFFHVQVRNREGETLTRQQWEHAADRIEKMLGLAGQPRAIAFHIDEKSGGEHMHVAWSRIDEETLTAKPLPFFKDRLKKISRELELHFALEPVTNKREGEIKYAPTRAQEEQARRLGLDIHEVRNAIRACYDRSDCGASFLAALENEGMVLAQGERRDFVVIDQGGGIHALGKRILDVTAARVRDRLSDLSREDLPTVEQTRDFLRDIAHDQKQELPDIKARLKQELAEVDRLLYGPSLTDLKRELKEVQDLIDKAQRSRQPEKPAPAWDRDRDDRAWQDAIIKAAIEKEQAERNFAEPGEKQRRAGGGREKKSAGGRITEQGPPELGQTAAAIRIAYSLTNTGQAFADALEDRGLILACMTEADAGRLNKWERCRVKEQEEALASGNSASQRSAQENARDRYRAEELVVVNQFGDVFQLSARNTGDGLKARTEHLKDVDRSALLSVSAAQSVMTEVREERREDRRVVAQQNRNEIYAPVSPPLLDERRPFNVAAADVCRDTRTEDLKGAAREVWEAWRQLDSDKRRAAAASGKTVSIGVPTKEEFAQALDDRGIMFAVVSKDEAERSHREGSFAKAIGRYAPRFKEGEVVLVSEPRPEFHRDGEIIAPRRVQKLDQSLADKFVNHLESRNQLRSIDATLELSNLRAQERRVAVTEKRMEAAGKPRDFSHTVATDIKQSAKAGRAALKTVGSALDAVGNALESLFAPTLTPAQIAEGNRTKERRDAETADAIDFSRYTAEMAQRSQQLENEQEAERQRMRGGGGRER